MSGAFSRPPAVLARKDFWGLLSQQVRPLSRHIGDLRGGPGGKGGQSVFPLQGQMLPFGLAVAAAAESKGRKPCGVPTGINPLTNDLQELKQQVENMSEGSKN